MTNLQIVRKHAGMSQSQLSEKSGVSVRMIQHYEQGAKDINKAAGITLYQIAQALETSIESILEIPE